jgi:hypothetical protein
MRKTLTFPTLCLLLVGSASALTISDTGVRANDISGDGIGNGITTSQTAAIGDSEDNKKEFRMIYDFNIDAHRTEISSASNILFQVDKISNPTTDFVVQLIAFDGKSAEDNINENSDFQLAGTVVTTFNTSTIIHTRTLSIDVTDYVKADATDTGDNYSSFRLQGVDLSNDNSVTDLLKTDGFGADLVIIPEPSTYALFACLLGFCSVMLRQRNQ